MGVSSLKGEEEGERRGWTFGLLSILKSGELRGFVLEKQKREGRKTGVRAKGEFLRRKP